MKPLTASMLLAIAALATLCGVTLRKSQLPLNHERPHLVRAITATSGQTGNSFGEALALDESTILVGAPLSIVAQGKCGAAYFYERDDAKSLNRYKQISEPGTPGSEFGATVAISGPSALVGAPGDSSGGESCGAVYSFENDGTGNWSQAARLQANPPIAKSHFGVALAMEQNRAVVGAAAVNGLGCVYFFEKDDSGDWRQVAFTTGNSRADLFGRSLAIAGDLAVIGVPGDSSVTPNGGSAHVFRRDRYQGWRKIAALAPRQPLPVNSRFGKAVAIAKSAIVVAAPGAGVTYVFREVTPGNWMDVAQLVAPGLRQPFMFGFAVAASDDVIAVASPLENHAAGCVYLFHSKKQDSWQQVARLELPGGGPSRCLGWSMALKRQSLLVGTDASAGGDPKPRTAYLYSLDEY